MDVGNWAHVAEAVVAAASVVAVFLFGWWVKIKAQQLQQSRDAFQFEQERIEADRKRKREDTEEARRQKREDEAAEDARVKDLIAEYQQLQILARKDKEADRKILHDVRDQCQTLTNKVAEMEAQHKRCQEENAALRTQVANLTMENVSFREALRRAKLWPWPTDRQTDPDPHTGGAP